MVTGITSRRFEVGAVPAAAAIRCAAADATSGVARGGCVVTGRSTALGPHTLTATATDAAGLRSTSILAYVVTRPGLAALKIPASLRSGRSATFGFRLAAPASLRFTVKRKRTGRRVGTRCLAPARTNRRKPACARFVRVGAITGRGRKGVNSLTFSGRVAGRRLAPGTYRISVIVIVGTVTSKVQTRTVIVRP